MYGSHIYMLLKAFEQTEGDVLELGCGFYSTPILKVLCTDKDRRFVSYETNVSWAGKFKGMTNVISDYSKIPIDKHWGLVFIDHLADRRAIDAVRLKDLADMIVLHDTEPEEDWRYGFSKIYHNFKYRFDYKKHKNWTTVLSNSKEFKI